MFTKNVERHATAAPAVLEAQGVLFERVQQLEAIEQRLRRCRELTDPHVEGGLGYSEAEVIEARMKRPQLEYQLGAAKLVVAEARERYADALDVEVKRIADELHGQRLPVVQRMYAALDKAAAINAELAAIEQRGLELTGRTLFESLTWAELFPDSATETSILEIRRGLARVYGADV